VVQTLGACQVGDFGSPLQLELMPDIQFTLEDQFQKLFKAKPVGRGFLKVDIQGRCQQALPKKMLAFWLE
jgi:hypothetical protein